jgi:hypothetical protein
MGGSCPESCITDPRNTKMEETSWGQRKMEAPFEGCKRHTWMDAYKRSGNVPVVPCRDYGKITTLFGQTHQFLDWNSNSRRSLYSTITAEPRIFVKTLLRKISDRKKEEVREGWRNVREVFVARRLGRLSHGKWDMQGMWRVRQRRQMLRDLGGKNQKHSLKNTRTHTKWI